MTGPGNENGVSVIVGTLLLILITVVAAAGLALMVSQMQKDEMNRQTHLAAVKNEQIQIANIGLANNRDAWNATPLNVPYDQEWQNWSSVTLTLVNLNTDGSRVIGVSINDHYSRNITAIADTPAADRTLYDIAGHEYLDIPGTRSQKIRINFTDDFPQVQYTPTGNQIQVRVMTSMYNTFEKTFRPPNPVFTTKIETDDLGSVQRDVLVLDGSASTADGSLADWNWTITGSANTFDHAGNWTDYARLNTTFAQGKTSRTTLPNAGPFRVSLRVTDTIGLTKVSDPVDIPAGNFNPPANLRFDEVTPPVPSPAGGPPYAYNQYNTTLTARLYDINNNPVADGAVVTIMIDNNPNVPQSCFAVQGMSNTTRGGEGRTTFLVMQKNTTAPGPASICPQPVTLHAQFGKLISPTILVPGIP